MSRGSRDRSREGRAVPHTQRGPSAQRGAGRAPAPASRSGTRGPAAGRPRLALLAAGAAGLVLVVVAAVALVGNLTAPSAVRDITVAQLRTELAHKDFTLLNVKTPYIGEIQGTDLYIPYDQLQARASELPSDRSAKLVVYCRSGNESAIAVQTLARMGYTHIENVIGGMQAWTAAGGVLVQGNR